jgi:hypothetical protein
VRRERALRLKFLFEHHGGRPVRCFLRTLLAGWRPGRFWRNLKPAMQIMPRRLATYAAIVLLLGILAAMSGFALEVAERTNQNLEQRRQANAYWASLTPQQKQGMATFAAGNYPAYVRSYTPLPLESAFWQQFPWQRSLLRALPLALLVVAWPALTLATLLIFRRSLRQAKIRFGHVARVVVYSGDVFAFTLPFLLIAAGFSAAGWLPLYDVVRQAPYPLDHVFHILPGLDDVLLATSLALLLLAGWRLARAYQLYLRFPHALATVLASQVIVWLALLSLGGPLLAIMQATFRLW